MKKSYTNSWALLIGINNYSTLGKLRFSVADATKTAEVLISFYGFPQENVTVLLDEKATKVNILESYLSYAEKANEDDRILFFFSGHGYTFSSRKGPVGYLVPFDGNLIRKDTLIRWDSLREDADLISAKHMLFVIDACYGGLILKKAAAQVPEHNQERYIHDMMTRYARQVITAGKADELVDDGGGPSESNSLFTGYLLEVLNHHKGSVSENILANTVMHEVAQKVNQDVSSSQSPHYGYLDGDGDFVFKSPQIISEDSQRSETEIVQIVTEIEGALKEQAAKDGLPNITQTLESYFSDPFKYRIQLDSFLTKEIQNVLLSYNTESFPTAPDTYPESIKSCLANYENIFYRLMVVIAFSARWAESPKQIFNKIVTAVSEVIEAKSGLTVWLNLRWYPLLLLLYSGGIACLIDERYDCLLDLFSAEVHAHTNYPQEETLLLPEVIEFVYGDILKLIQSVLDQKYIVPVSQYLHEFLSPFFKDIFSLSDKSFNSLFDKYEIFQALNYSFMEDSNWAPPGNFTWKFWRGYSDNPYSLFRKDADRLQNNWKPLRDGMFSGDIEIFNNQYNRVKTFMEQNRRW